VAPLEELLKRYQEQAISAKDSKLSRISLVDGDTWMIGHDPAFSRVKDLTNHTVTSNHPKQGYEMCLLTDARDFHWEIT
jgi:hypothetical protein